MARTYRNALRSQAMIRQAFVELLAEKSLEKITVAEIVSRADLCRNTFYAHYQDVYAVMEELENEVLQRFEQALDEAVAHENLSDPLPFLRMMAEAVAENGMMLRLLFRGSRADVLVGRLKATLVVKIHTHVDTAGIRDEQGFLLMVDMLSAGFVHLFREYLHGQTKATPQEIAEAINRVYKAAVPLYK